MNGHHARENQSTNTSNRLTAVLLVIYLMALCWILLLKFGVRFSYMHNRRVSLIPFNQYIQYGTLNMSETLLNVAVFIPLGVYAGILFNSWNFSKKLLFFFLVSLTVEGLQYILAVG